MALLRSLVHVGNNKVMRLAGFKVPANQHSLVQRTRTASVMLSTGKAQRKSGLVAKTIVESCQKLNEHNDLELDALFAVVACDDAPFKHFLVLLSILRLGTDFLSALQDHMESLASRVLAVRLTVAA